MDFFLRKMLCVWLFAFHQLIGQTGSRRRVDPAEGPLTGQRPALVLALALHSLQQGALFAPPLAALSATCM